MSDAAAVRKPMTLTKIKVVEVVSPGLDIPSDRMAESGTGTGTVWNRRVPFRQSGCSVFCFGRYAVVDPPPYSVIIANRDRARVRVNTVSPVFGGSERDGDPWEIATAVGVEVIQKQVLWSKSSREIRHSHLYAMRMPSGVERGVVVLRARHPSMSVGNKAFIKGDLMVVVVTSSGSSFSCPRPPVIVCANDHSFDQTYVPVIPGQDLLLLGSGRQPETVPEELSLVAESSVNETTAGFYRCVANPSVNEPYLVSGRRGEDGFVLPAVMPYGDHYSYIVITEPMPSVRAYCGNITGFRVDMLSRVKVDNRSPGKIKQVFEDTGKSFGFFVEKGIGWVRLCRAASTLTLHAEEI